MTVYESSAIRQNQAARTLVRAVFYVASIGTLAAFEGDMVNLIALRHI